jgi:hypothetical protein
MNKYLECQVEFAYNIPMSLMRVLERLECQEILCSPGNDGVIQPADDPRTPPPHPLVYIFEYVFLPRILYFSSSLLLFLFFFLSLNSLSNYQHRTASCIKQTTQSILNINSQVSVHMTAINRSLAYYR